MPSGEKVSERQRRHTLQLLRQSYREGSALKRSQIPEIVGLHRDTVSLIRDQAAIKWLEELEQAERLGDLRDRAD